MCIRDRPYTIYSAICSSPVRFDMAGVLSSYLMVMIVIAMIVQYQAMGKKKYDFLDNGTEQVMARKPKKPAGILLSVISTVFCVIALGIPVGSNLIMSFSSSVSIQKFVFTTENYRQVFSSTDTMISGIRHSLGLAAVSAVLGIVKMCIRDRYDSTYFVVLVRRLRCPQLL